MDLLDKFLSSRASGTSPKPIRIYHLALDNFVGYPLTSEGINAYLNSLTCGNAKHNYYRCIKTLCRWLYHTDQLPTNPIEKVLPPRSWSEGTTLYMVADPGTKRDNIGANPRVSVGIHDPYVGPLSAKGIQITGEATLITDENPEYDEALMMLRRGKVGEEIGQYKPPRGHTLIKVESKKIELIEIALKLRGYAARQVWEA